MQKVFTDQMGREVSINYPPKRIISIVPSQTELLFDLGLDDEVIGITKFCIHPIEKFAAKTKIGGTKKLLIEKIRDLKPDLIIGNKEENTQSEVELH
jgi:ABC-type Fe3+-hydroxamate transport system substrate-binding protein